LAVSVEMLERLVLVVPVVEQQSVVLAVPVVLVVLEERPILVA
jgi:hypothetical protein